MSLARDPADAGAPQAGLAPIALRVALIVTAAWGLLVAVRAAAGISFRGRVADILQFVLLIAYVTLVPIAAGLALALGRRLHRSPVLPAALLAIWGAFLIWLTTLTF